MRKYYLNLKSKLEELSNLSKKGLDRVKKAKFQYEYDLFEEVVKQFKVIFYNNYANDKTITNLPTNLQNIIKSYQDQANEKNNELDNLHKKRTENYIANHKKTIENILAKNPKAGDEENRDTEEYRRINEAKTKINQLEEDLKNPKYEKMTPAHYMLDKEFDFFFDKIMVQVEENPKLGIKDEEELKDEVLQLKTKLEDPKNYEFAIKDNLDYLYNQGFLKEKSKEIYKNEMKTLQELTSTVSYQFADEQYTKLIVPIEKELSSEVKSLFEPGSNEAGLGSLAEYKSYGFKDTNNNKDYNKIIRAIKPIKDTGNAEKIKQILEFMDSLGMVPEGASSSESKNKEYGFINFIKAKKELIDVASKKGYYFKPDDFVEKFNNLKKEAEKIDRIYMMIHNLLGDDLDTIPTNVDSIRNTDVPQKYKNQLALQAKFNNLYITLAFIKEHNLSIDEFVKNPVQQARFALNEEYKKRRIDNVLKDKTKLEALLELSEVKTERKALDSYPYTRCFELFVTNEKNDEIKTNGIVTSAAVTKEVNGIKKSVDLIYDYFSDADISQTLQNIFVGNNNLSYESALVSKNGYEMNLRTGAKMEENQTLLDRVSNVNSFEVKFEEALQTIQAFKNQKGNAMRTIDENKMFEALQDLTAKFITTHDLDKKDIDGHRLYSKDFVKRMKKFVSDPMKLEDVRTMGINIDPEHQRTVTRFMKKGESLKKKATKIAEKAVSKDVKTYYKRMKAQQKLITSLEKQYDKAYAKCERYSNDIHGQKYRLYDEQKTTLHRELINARNTLTNMPGDEIERLKSAYKSNNINKYYLEKRVQQIKNANDISKQPAMFLHQEKNYKSFKNYARNVLHLTNEQMRDAAFVREKKIEYQAIIDQSRAEKNAFFMANALADTSMASFKEKNPDIVLNNKGRNVEDIIQERNQANKISVDLEDEIPNYVEEVKDELNKEKNLVA